MTEKITNLKQYITDLAANPEFIHHKWFVKYHLEVVEKIALELCNDYPDANKDAVQTLVWVHDFGKLIDFKHEHDIDIISQVEKPLQELKFEAKFISEIIENIKLFDRNPTEDLSKAPIEVQIVSSADAASHVISPFYLLYWYENPDKDIEEILVENRKKLQRDWDRKMVLPEAQQKYKKNYDVMKEIFSI